MAGRPWSATSSRSPPAGGAAPPLADATLASWASAVVVLNEATLDSLARRLPYLRGTPAGDDALLPGKVAGPFDVRTQQWRKLKWVDDVRANKKLRARSMANPSAGKADLRHVEPGPGSHGGVCGAC